MTPLHLASKFGNVVIVKKILEALGNDYSCLYQMSNANSLPLHSACTINNNEDIIEIVKLMLDKLVMVNQDKALSCKNSNLMTALDIGKLRIMHQ